MRKEENTTETAAHASETTSFAGEDGVYTLFKFMSYPTKKHGCPSDVDRRKWVEDLLTDGELYFPTAPQMNDPFEVSPDFYLENESSEEMYKRFSQHLTGTYAPLNNLSERKVGELDRDLANRIREQVFAKQIDGKAADWRKGLQGVPMCCMSATRESSLLWAHYAEGHSGVCVHIDSYNYKNNIFTTAMRVVYSKTYPRIQLPASALPYKTFLTKMFLTKSCVWSHEQEYRMVNIRGMYNDFLYWKAPQKAKIDPRLIRGVTVGARMEGNDIESILRACHKHRYKVEHAQQRKDTFDLKFERVDN